MPALCSLPIYAAVPMTYVMGLPGLSMSELAIVLFILLLIIVAGRLPRWGEALGSYLYKRGKSGPSEGEGSASEDGRASRPPEGAVGDPWPGNRKPR